MIIDHSRRLHMSITDGRSDEFKTPLAQILAETLRISASRRVFLQLSQFVNDGLKIHESPDIPVEASELFLNLEEIFWRC